MSTDFHALALEVEASGGQLSEKLSGRISEALSGLRRDLDVSPESLSSTEAVIHLTDLVAPGWSITLRGKALEPNGHWHCSLRRSAGRDNDEFLGVGKSPSLPLAILAASLHVLGYQTRAT